MPENRFKQLNEITTIAVMMMPKNNPARKLASKAATKVEDAAMRVTDKMTDAME